MISSFSLCVGLGAGLGMAWVSWRAPKDRTGLWMNAGLIVLLGALLGSRAAFVLTHLAYYQAHWLDALQIWQGGLSWPGGLIRFVACLGLIAWLTRTPLGALSDGLMLLALPLVIGIWLGSWLSGVAYGRLAQGVWWALPAPDEWGEWSSRIPVQILGAAMTILIFMLVDWIRPSLKRPGQAASLAFTAVSLLLLGLSSLRADPVPIWQGLRWDTLAAAAIAGFSLLIDLVAFWPQGAGSKIIDQERHEITET